MRPFILLFFSMIWAQINAQVVSETILPSMPEPVANNAVATATVNGILHLYSFSGIDESRDWFGLHLKGFRYNTQTQVWDTLPPLPDPNGGKIAAGASTVKNKIYIIGGYHVASNYSETSSAKVHIFDPETNAYLPDGADIPVAIDDQVQAVWRDSLIFVVTGWSNTTNVPDVQIYDPATDTWSVGTSVPNNNNYKAFGASGTIIGDTLYYIGGARFGFNFPAATVLRKGYIDPSDPMDITWSHVSSIPEARGYRMAAARYEKDVIWLGGSNVTYNFDGIAYNGSGAVAPQGWVKLYEPDNGLLTEFPDLISPTMDFRGVAELGNGRYILAGGMTAGPTVTDQVFLIEIDQLSSTDELLSSDISTPVFYPNPTQGELHWTLPDVERIRVLDAVGRLVEEWTTGMALSMQLGNLPEGVYTVIGYGKNGVLMTTERVLHIGQ